MTDAPRPSYQRSARNYLLDKPFQLKYTGMLIGIAVVMSAALGGLLWYSSRLIVEQSEKTVELGNETVEQSRETLKQGREAVVQGADTVEQSKKTVARGQEVIEEARKVSEVVTMQIDNCYGDNPVLKETFKKGADEDETKRKKEQEALEAESQSLAVKAEGYKARAEALEKRNAALESRTADLKKQKEEIGRGQRNMFIGLVTALTLLVLGIGVAGIIFTHKIAGPIFKMKRLMREVGEGKLVIKEKLRKGDELHHFFETFEKMVEKMRTNQRAEIKRLEAILENFGSAGDFRTDASGAEQARKDLETLIADMKDHIDEGPASQAAKRAKSGGKGKA